MIHLFQQKTVQHHVESIPEARGSFSVEIINMIMFLHNLVLCQTAISLMRGFISWIGFMHCHVLHRYLLDMYTCMYIYIYCIKMSRAVDSLHEISVYQYHSKIVYHDITSVRQMTSSYLIISGRKYRLSNHISRIEQLPIWARILEICKYGIIYFYDRMNFMHAM
mgnify:CR=1 FL=1